MQKYTIGATETVHIREVSLFQRCPLREVPLVSLSCVVFLNSSTFALTAILNSLMTGRTDWVILLLKKPHESEAYCSPILITFTPNDIIIVA